jgi:alcohol dehydrogenase
MRFGFLTTPEIRFGPAESRNVREILARFGRRPFLVTGGKSFETLPVASLLGDLPRLAVSGEPELETVDPGVLRCRESGADVVLAVGGGSVLDTAKAIAGLAPNSGSVREYLEQVGDRRLEHPPLPWIAVPTTAGSGSEATKNAVIRVPDLGVKRSLRDDRLLPRLAVVDPELSRSAPRPVAASAGLDAITHLIEGYVSLGAQPVTDALALPGIRLAWRGLEALAAGLVTEDSSEAMALGSLWGGIVLANAGLGAVHGLVAPLGGRCRIPHGVGCAGLLVEGTRANLEALRSRKPGSPALRRYAEIAGALGAAGADEALEKLRSLGRSLGIPSLGALGASPADIEPIVKNARGGSMKYNPVELSDPELSGILRNSL